MDGRRWRDGYRVEYLDQKKKKQVNMTMGKSFIIYVTHQILIWSLNKTL
jgi:hypothetical protein